MAEQHSTQCVYRGQLVWATLEYDEEIVGMLDPDTFRVRLLAQAIAYDVQDHGRYGMVQYQVADPPLAALTESTEVRFSGVVDAAYELGWYVEEGMLHVTETCMIGTYDLLAALKQHVGMYLYLQITYANEPVLQG